ncbi:alpha/beta hydrolase family protein [Paenibacillus mesotrionivorans]|uniref:Alpha/beta hydrolase family protein n=1 Tax=Paenibacillus mesotrionivorans TaxID=3160968 RepID=A0ACC7P3F8_9BACL
MENEAGEAGIKIPDWTTDAFLGTLYERTAARRQENRRNAGKPEQQAWLRSRLKAALGGFPERDHPLRARKLERTEYKDFILERVVYTTMESVHVPVMVQIPKKGQGPWPAVLACHGHGSGQRDAAGLDELGRELEEPGIHNRFAVQLVRKGMLVVIPEIMGFGVRRMAEELKANPHYSSCGTLASQLLMYGRTLAGMRVFEAMRALDYMASRPDVDSSRMGVFGFSGGGLIAAFTAGLDERVQAAVLCGWANTFRGSTLAMHHCIDNYLPGLLLDTEQPELAGLMAPRALFVESGDQDPIFPVEHTRQAIAWLEAHYSAWDAPGQFAWDIHPGGHEINGRKSAEWLLRKLGVGQVPGLEAE